MNTHTALPVPAWLHAIRHFFERSASGASSGLEAYLSNAQSLHELENLQRQWDRSQRGNRGHDAF